MSAEFITEIENLIDSKREGTYWDFKDKHHDNKALLLHDILCLANALYKGNKYLIYGVSDPSDHKFHPEYQIEFCGVEEGREAFSYFYPNESSAFGTAKFKYLSTELFQLGYMYYDERRITLPIPKYGYVQNRGRVIYYLYYLLDGRDGAFLEFFTDGTLNLSSKGGKAAFVIFHNTPEKESFEQFLSLRIDQFDAMPESEWEQLILHSAEEISEHHTQQIKEMCKVLATHRKWKASTQNACFESHLPFKCMSSINTFLFIRRESGLQSSRGFSQQARIVVRGRETATPPTTRSGRLLEQEFYSSVGVTRWS